MAQLVVGGHCEENPQVLGARWGWPEEPIEAPPPDDVVAYGRYLTTAQWQCFGCHSEDLATVNDLEPEESAGYLGGGNPMPGVAGQIVFSSNITPDPETGIGRWTLEEFKRAVVEGVTPDNRVLRQWLSRRHRSRPVGPAQGPRALSHRRGAHRVHQAPRGRQARHRHAHLGRGDPGG